MDVDRIQSTWPQVLVCMRDICWTNHKRTGDRFELPVTHRELGRTFDDVEYFIVRMNVKIGAFTDDIGAVTNHHTFRTEVMTFLGSCMDRGHGYQVYEDIGTRRARDFSKVYEDMGSSFESSGDSL